MNGVRRSSRVNDVNSAKEERCAWRTPRERDSGNASIGFPCVYGVIVGGGNAAAGYRGRSSIRLNASMREVKEYRGFRLNGVYRGCSTHSSFSAKNVRSGYRVQATRLVVGMGLGFRSEWCIKVVCV